MKTKKCRKCDTVKYIEDFYNLKTSKDGKDIKCKICANKYRKKYTAVGEPKHTCYIYIVTHPLFVGYVKVGMSKNVNTRLKQYQTCCPVNNYEMPFFVKSKNPREIEEYFRNNVNRSSGEWYIIEVDKAIEIINRILKQ